MSSLPKSGVPSPDRAERNQRRKLAFVPMWPLVASVVLLVVVILLLGR